MFNIGTGTLVQATESQLLTRAAPTAASFTVTLQSDPTTKGVSLLLNRISGFRVMLAAEAGATLSGGGNLRCWMLDAATGNVCRNPGLDLAIPAAIAGVRFLVFPDQLVVVNDGSRLMYANDTVTASAGTNAVVSINAWGY